MDPCQLRRAKHQLDSRESPPTFSATSLRPSHASAVGSIHLALQVRPCASIVVADIRDVIRR